MARIGLKVGETISYLGRDYDVVEVYPYIAGLRTHTQDRSWIINNGVFYVGIGDLVMSGLSHKILGIGGVPSGPSAPTLKKQPAGVV